MGGAGGLKQVYDLNFTVIIRVYFGWGTCPHHSYMWFRLHPPPPPPMKIDPILRRMKKNKKMIDGTRCQKSGEEAYWSITMSP